MAGAAGAHLLPRLRAQERNPRRHRARTRLQPGPGARPGTGARPGGPALQRLHPRPLRPKLFNLAAAGRWPWWTGPHGPVRPPRHRSGKNAPVAALGRPGVGLHRHFTGRALRPMPTPRWKVWRCAGSARPAALRSKRAGRALRALPRPCCCQTTVITVPVLLLEGGQDIVVEADAQREFCTRARGCVE